MTKIIVVSSQAQPRPCAGHSFVGSQEFMPDHFTAEQLEQIAADRVLTVVVGKVLKPDEVGEFMDQVEKWNAAKAAEAQAAADGASAEAVEAAAAAAAGAGKGASKAKG